MESFLNTYLPTTVVGIIFFIGFIGSFLPILPAAIIVWAGALLHKVWVPEHSISWKFFIIITLGAIICQLLDWVLTYWGARKFGASWRGGVGAILGIPIGIVFFTPIIGLIIGPVIGAVCAELIGGNTLRGSSKAGAGTIVGGFIAFMLKLGITCFMIVGFFVNLNLQ